MRRAESEGWQQNALADGEKNKGSDKMIILIKEFGGIEQGSTKTIAERNEFARNHKIIADQTHLIENRWLFVLSFYEENDYTSERIVPVKASEKQKAFMRNLNISFAEDISKEQVSLTEYENERNCDPKRSCDGFCMT